jgi:hypothetical protein
MPVGSPREPAHDLDQLVVCGAARITEVADRVRIGKPTEARQLADSLSAVQLQLGSPVSEQDAPQVTIPEQVVELRSRHIDQEQDEYPKRDCDKTMPGKGRDHMWEEMEMKTAPVIAAMREFDMSSAAASGTSNHSARANPKIRMPSLKRHPAAEAGASLLATAMNGPPRKMDI